MIHADGHRIWVRAVGSVEFADGKPVRLIGAFQDASERVCQQQALTEASARAGLATESGGIGIWDRNLDTQALAWDPRMHDLFGDPQGAADPVELWRHRVHPDDLEATERAMETAAVGGTPFDTEFRVVWPDGSVHHVRGAARVTRDASGRALRLTGANWDTTELRRLAADLAESEARTQTVALSDRDLASYVDRAYTYRLVNQTYLDYWLLERTAIVVGQAAFQGFAKPNLDRAFAGEEIRYEAESGRISRPSSNYGEQERFGAAEDAKFVSEVRGTCDPQMPEFCCLDPYQPTGSRTGPRALLRQGPVGVKSPKLQWRSN